MKILIGQINTTPGDFSGNLNKILDGLSQIDPQNQPDLAIFPELSIPGYLCQDLMYSDSFIDRNLESLMRIQIYSTSLPKVNIVVGYIDKNHSGVGKHFRNMTAVIKNGTIIGTYQKHLLPFYGIFNEARYWEPGKDLFVFNVNGVKCGITCCEDLWNDKGVDDYNYKDNPVQSYIDVGVKCLINISSSPYVINKPQRRIKMIKEITGGFGRNLTVVYVNQVGGQDHVVFDGNSMIVENGKLMWQPVKNNEENYSFVNTKELKEIAYLPFTQDIVIAELYKMLVLSLRDYIVKSGFKSIVLGSSGGIDSAVVAAIAADAIGPKNVNCIMMPSVWSSEGSVKDAQQLHTNLGCNEYKVPIEHTTLINSIKSNLNMTNETQYNKIADENIQARMRAQIVMYYSNALGSLALTTGNKTELATGYFTLFGDSCGGFAPICDLYKLQVFSIARYINHLHGKEIIPLAIINKPPSAELAPDQTDEVSLLPYKILDRIVEGLIENYIDTFSEFSVWMTEQFMIGRDPDKTVTNWSLDETNKKEYDRIIRTIKINEFKRKQTAIGTHVSKVAFGPGRIYPICKKI